jgi:hypothetical protein
MSARARLWIETDFLEPILFFGEAEICVGSYGARIVWNQNFTVSTVWTGSRRLAQQHFMGLVYIFASRFMKVHFNIVFASTSICLTWSLDFRFFGQDFLCILVGACMLNTLSMSVHLTVMTP